MSRVLVADDDDTFRSILLKVLSQNNFDAVGVADGIEALKAIIKYDFRVLVTDLLMPDMDGLELIRTVKKAYPQISIIAISGGSRTGENYVETARVFGASEIMRKPVNFDAFTNAVKRCVEDH